MHKVAVILPVQDSGSGFCEILKKNQKERNKTGLQDGYYQQNQANGSKLETSLGQQWGQSPQWWSFFTRALPTTTQQGSGGGCQRPSAFPFPRDLRAGSRLRVALPVEISPAALAQSQQLFLAQFGKLVNSNDPVTLSACQ